MPLLEILKPYTLEQIAAVVGAAAWLPQIGSWIYRLVRKPKIVIIPDSFIELGYTNLGPIFNIRLAVSTDIQDVLLDGFQVSVKHKDGNSKTFDWRATKETLNQTRDATGILHTVEKEETGIAVKVRPDTLVDKLFRFQHAVSALELKPLIENLDKQINFQRSKGDINRDALMDSAEIHLLVSTLKTKFSWSPGQYVATFTCKAINSSVSQKPSKFNFELTTQNIEQLRQNDNLFGPFIEWNVFQGKQGTVIQLPQFNWVYPQIIRSDA